MLTINTSTTSNTKDNFPDSLYSHSIIILLGYSNYKKDSINKFDRIVKTNGHTKYMTHVANMAATYAVTALPHQCFGLDKTCFMEECSNYEVW